MRWPSHFRIKFTSEPVTFLYMFAIGIYSSMIPNIIQQKVCSPSFQPDLNYVCNNTLLNEATDIGTIRSSIREMLPFLAILFAGWWRDATGLNKPIIFMALFGEIVGVVIELIGAWQWTISPWIISITDAVINGLLGGSKLFLVGVTLVISDNSKVENRTTRLGFFMAAMIAGSGISFGVSGYVFQFLGYQWLFVFVIGLHLLSIILVIFIKDNDRKPTLEGRWESFRKLKAVTDSRPNNTVIWLMIISYCLVAVSTTAEGNNYLYYLQQGFDFMVTGAGVYTSYRYCLGVLSSIVMPPLFSKVLGLSDFNIGIISSLLTIVSGIAMAFAKTSLELIIFAWLDVLKILLLTIPKSIITKAVKPEEVGVFMSLFSLGECLLPIGIFFVYNKIFQATSHSMPGAMFLATTSLTIVVLIFYSISSLIYKVPKVESLDKEGENDLENESKI